MKRIEEEGYHAKAVPEKRRQDSRAEADRGEHFVEIRE
jgi:hypothetical protein